MGPFPHLNKSLHAISQKSCNHVSVSSLVLFFMVYAIMPSVSRYCAKIAKMTRATTVLNTVKNVKGMASYSIHLVV